MDQGLDAAAGLGRVEVDVAAIDMGSIPAASGDLDHDIEEEQQDQHGPSGEHAGASTLGGETILVPPREHEPDARGDEEAGQVAARQDPRRSAGAVQKPGDGVSLDRPQVAHLGSGRAGTPAMSGRERAAVGPLSLREFALVTFTRPAGLSVRGGRVCRACGGLSTTSSPHQDVPMAHRSTDSRNSLHELA